MGSYVLVSHQSQACSSHRTESCITTRTPWLGRSTGSPREGRPEPAQPSKELLLEVGNQSQHSQGIASWKEGQSCCLKLVRGLGCSIYQGTVEGCGVDKKAELETRIFVGYIYYV